MDVSTSPHDAARQLEVLQSLRQKSLSVGCAPTLTIAKTIVHNVGQLLEAGRNVRQQHVRPITEARALQQNQLVVDMSFSQAFGVPLCAPEPEIIPGTPRMCTFPRRPLPTVSQCSPRKRKPRIVLSIPAEFFRPHPEPRSLPIGVRKPTNSANVYLPV